MQTILDPEANAPAMLESVATCPLSVLSIWHGLEPMLAHPDRLLRFLAVGGGCGMAQLALLVGFKAVRLAPLPANLTAYLLSAQLNFLLSNRFISGDRWSGTAPAHNLPRRWLGFHGSIAVTLLLSQVVFMMVRGVLPDVAASALGLALAGVANFLIQDRLTFRHLG